MYTLLGNTGDNRSCSFRSRQANWRCSYFSSLNVSDSIRTTMAFSADKMRQMTEMKLTTQLLGKSVLKSERWVQFTLKEMCFATFSMLTLRANYLKGRQCCLATCPSHSGLDCSWFLDISFPSFFSKLNSVCFFWKVLEISQNFKNC